MPTFLALVGMFISVMLIGIILLQRGRGGGLVGALSGLGGQSAFGTKAGDTFTRITIGIAAAWVLLAGIHGHVLRDQVEKFKGNDVKEIGSSSKDKGAGTSSTNSDDSKSDFGLGSLADEPKDDSVKEGDSKKKSKSDEPVKGEKPEGSKKSDTEDKPAESKDDTKPKDESKPDGESK